MREKGEETELFFFFGPKDVKNKEIVALSEK